MKTVIAFVMFAFASVVFATDAPKVEVKPETKAEVKKEVAKAKKEVAKAEAPKAEAKK